MRRYLWPVLAATVVAGIPRAARAEWWEKFWHSVEQDFQRNIYWPEPFNYADRQAVHSPFAVQVQNGWRMQNTLGAHFSDDGLKLTEAGRLRVQTIVTQSPPQFRAIYVEAGDSPEMTAERIRAIRDAAVRYGVEGETAEVYATNNPPRGTPGEYVNSITTAFQRSHPQPRLPSGASDSSGGTGTAGAQ